MLADCCFALAIACDICFVVILVTPDELEPLDELDDFDELETYTTSPPPLTTVELFPEVFGVIELEPLDELDDFDELLDELLAFTVEPVEV